MHLFAAALNDLSENAALSPAAATLVRGSTHRWRATAPRSARLGNGHRGPLARVAFPLAICLPINARGHSPSSHEVPGEMSLVAEASGERHF